MQEECGSFASTNFDHCDDKYLLSRFVDYANELSTCMCQTLLFKKKLQAANSLNMQKQNKIVWVKKAAWYGLLSTTANLSHDQISRLVAIVAIVSSSSGLSNRFSTLQITVYLNCYLDCWIISL